MASASPSPTPTLGAQGVEQLSTVAHDEEKNNTTSSTDKDSSAGGDGHNAGPADGTSPAPAKKPFAFHMSMISLALMVFVVSWDATSLAVAIPVIASELNATTLESFWASISFMLAVAVTQPIYASVSNVLGRKLPLYAALALFGAGCIVFALAESMAVVIAGRVLQGLGGGGLDVLEAIILSDVTTLKERPLYMGIMAIPIAVGTILGPIVGSVFAEYVTWRWIGWVNLPFVGLAAFLAVFFLHLRPIEMGFAAKLQRLDWAGMLLFACGATCFALPLSWAGALYPWSSWRTILPFVIGLLLLALFAWYEKRPAEAVMPYRIFESRTSQMALFGAFVHGLIMYTMLLYLPLFFQAVYLQNPLGSAIQILPVCCVVVGFSVIGPVSVQLLHRYRPQLWVGWILQTLFLGLFCMLDRTTPLGVADTFQVFLGVGIGIVFMTTGIPMQAAVSARNVDDAGLAAGLLIVFRLFGALVGLAIGASVFSSVFATSIAAVGALPDALADLRDASHAVGFIPALRSVHGVDSETLDAVVEAYRTTFRAIWITMTCLSGVGSVSVAFLGKHDLDGEEMGRQRFDHPGEK